MKINAPILRGAIAGLVGGFAWLVGIAVFFGPMQFILADPDLQSEKMLAAFSGYPPPRSVEQPWILLVGLLIIGVLWGWIYAWISRPWSLLPWWQRGLRFAVIGWTLMVPWFMFFLPWNVLREPAPLVALEMLCWAGVMLCVGLTIAGVEAALSPGPKRR